MRGEVASENSLILGGYSSEKDGAVVFSGVAHATDDDNYLVTKVRFTQNQSDLFVVRLFVVSS